MYDLKIETAKGFKNETILTLLTEQTLKNVEI